MRWKERLRIRHSPEERELVDAMAGGNTSAWVRELLLKGAKEFRNEVPASGGPDGHLARAGRPHCDAIAPSSGL